MLTVKKTVATAIATGALFLNLAVPTFAATTIEISGNGALTNNDANITLTQTTTVVQDNVAKIDNDVDVDADTGGNTANFNNGGDVTIDTGDADVDVAVTNLANSNTANVDCCPTGDMEVLISGNAALSTNTANLTSANTTTVSQTNDADVDNDVDVDADTGDNDAGFNNGGDVTIRTGKAKANVEVTTAANANSAQIGGDAEDAASLTLRILDNGAQSDNDINLALTSYAIVVQDNKADVDNDVDVDADTGDNSANFNNGGDVTIDTGDADVDVSVDNLVNFNHLDADCGCPFISDLLVKVHGNAALSTNTINATLASVATDFQTNDADLDNDLKDLDADTGYNDSSYNNAGGAGDTDPSVLTGEVDVDVEVTNEANHNIVGDASLPGLPDLGDLDLSFDLVALLVMLGVV